MSDDGTLNGDSALHSLPRLGFSETVEFDNLVEKNPFLYRVYTPKAHSPSICYDKKIFCLAPRFNTKYSSPVDDVALLSPTVPVAESATSSDVTRHMDWTTRSSSCYISTSFSFAWAIWEAMRRYKTGYKHDVEIAVIDAASLKGRAVTGVQVMRQVPAAERPHDDERWYRISEESQSVLIYGYIPLSSVMSSIPLLSILDKLPSYFLRRELEPLKQQLLRTPFDHVAWDFANKKASFKHFCHDMVDRYFEDSAEIRLHSTIVESVRLAVAFLHPWFHEWAPKDLATAVAKVAELACLIAAWPDPEDPAEMTGVISGMIALLADEVREKDTASLTGDVLELAGVIDDLEGVVSALEERLESQAKQPEVRWSDAQSRVSPLRIAIPPPPSTSSSSSRASSVSPLTPNSFDHLSMPGLHDSIMERKRLTSLPFSSPPLSLTQYFANLSSSGKQTFASSPQFSHPSSPTPHSSVAVQATFDSDAAPDSPPPEPRNRLSLTVSYALTGFFLGTFLTLCVASSTSQRRTVLLHLT
ncbi:hypothetical protein BDZ89DRAFT_1064757 [Hymenopellis radicata]|nr:hypothetical protein BDZ89DRAFT_1064757 [Hymenopellis radicata]